MVEHTVDGVKSGIPKAAWILGVMALAFGLSEGTAADWSSIHVTDVANVDPTTGALGLVVVSAFMVVIRLLGDRLVMRFGRRAVVRFGGLCAALGYATVTLVSGLPLAAARLGVGRLRRRHDRAAGVRGCGPHRRRAGTRCGRDVRLCSVPDRPGFHGIPGQSGSGFITRWLYRHCCVPASSPWRPPCRATTLTSPRMRAEPVEVRVLPSTGSGHMHGLRAHARAQGTCTGSGREISTSRLFTSRLRM